MPPRSKVRAGIKRRADTTQDTTQQILATEMQGVSETAAVNMPSLENIRRNIRYQRQDNPLPNPLHRNDIPAILPHEYQVTSMEEPFLLLDSGVDDPERFFIFGSNRGLQLLGQSQHWYADGTFKVCPQVFFQVYTIHAQINGQVLPCVFSLLPNKAERTYDRLFQEIINLIPNFEDGPMSILLDFERAAMNVAETRLPYSNVTGCFFHLSSNIRKRIQSLGLQDRYNNDEVFALNLRMISAIAFAPPDDVIESFDILTDELRRQFGDALEDLLQYFEDTYIGRFRRNLPRRAPMDAIEVWNMFHRTDDELPRTNNSVEGWHRSFQCSLSACHPTFWKFLD